MIVVSSAPSPLDTIELLRTSYPTTLQRMAPAASCARMTLQLWKRNSEGARRRTAGRECASEMVERGVPAFFFLHQIPHAPGARDGEVLPSRTSTDTVR